MQTLGVTFGQLAFQLPMLVVLVVGFALIPGRRARIGARRSGLAMGGLAVLALELALSVVSFALGTALLQQRTISVSSFSVIAPVLSILLTVLTAGGVGLLLAAALTADSPRYPAPGPGPVQHSAPDTGTWPT